MVKSFWHGFNRYGTPVITYPPYDGYAVGDSITIQWEKFKGAKFYLLDGTEVYGLEKTITVSEGEQTVDLYAQRASLISQGLTHRWYQVASIELPEIDSPTEGYSFTLGSLPDVVTITSNTKVYYDEYYFQVYTSADVLVSEGVGGAGGSPEQYEQTISSYGNYKCRVKAKLIGGDYGDYSEFVNFKVIPEGG